jgi:hypothetical protein
MIGLFKNSCFFSVEHLGQTYTSNFSASSGVILTQKPCNQSAQTSQPI